MATMARNNTSTSTSSVPISSDILTTEIAADPALGVVPVTTPAPEPGAGASVQGTTVPEAGAAAPGTLPGAVPGSNTATSADTIGGVGIEGEVVVWEATYSLKNFLGRFIGAAVMVVGWVVLMVYAWEYE